MLASGMGAAQPPDMGEAIRMPEEEGAPTEPTGEGQQEPARPGTGEKDWKAEAEKWQAHAKKHEGLWKSAEGFNPKEIESLREKAKKLAELEERDKTEAQKAADKATAAEQRATEAEAKALRFEVAAAKGVPADLLAGSTQEEMESRADALIAFRGEAQTPSETPGTTRRPTEQLKPGASSTSSDTPEDPLLRDLKAKVGIQ